MKLTSFFLALALSTSAFAVVVGEDSKTSGSTFRCCPTGKCEDKTLPVCAGVVQSGDKLPGFAPAKPRTNGRRTKTRAE